MFGLFDSKNQKVVKKWEKEHEEIVVLAGKVIEAYSKNNPKKVRSVLKDLSQKTTAHLMNEDLEFFRIMKDTKRMDSKTEELINDFKKSFTGVKVELMSFLKDYSEDDSIIDDKFFKAFNGLIEVVAERIKFEEENLYVLLHSK